MALDALPLLELREGWRAEKAQTYGSVSVAGYGGRLSARHVQRLFGTGPRFPVSSPALPTLAESASLALK
jgi:hypothetical protein